MTLQVPDLRTAAAVLLLAVCVSPAKAQSGEAQAETRSVADSVYTRAQAERGEATFRTICTACHVLGDFTGEPFLKRWPTLGGLFEVVSTTMPDDLPGSLSAQQYAELIAYILSSNDFPPGMVELPAEAMPLNAIRVLPPLR